MKNHLIVLLIAGASVMGYAQSKPNPSLVEAATWRLGWRMIMNSTEENYELAELQFDSLLNLADDIDRRFLIAGVEAKVKLDKKEEAIEILNAQNEKMLREVCLRKLLGKMKPCKGFSEEKVENKSLQMELIRMYVDDQAARGNIMEDIVTKYNLDTTQITQNGAVGIDERNRKRLKAIFAEYGFPTRKLVGRDAMFGVFLMIQHADEDKEWQKSQLKNIEKAVTNGDLDGQSYAYLYDRIKINSGKPQLYGTQFAKVDPINEVVELAETKDLSGLNKRRRLLGMMPVDVYKELVFKNL